MSAEIQGNSFGIGDEEPDNSIYDAMNKGLCSLDGDDVCFLNVGDFLPTSTTVSSIDVQWTISRRTDFAIATPYNQKYRYSADVDWCIRIMKAAAKENVPLLNLHMVVVNYTEEGQTTLHHRESLLERYRVMESHYGRISTFFMHCWFVIRSVISR